MEMTFTTYQHKGPVLPLTPPKKRRKIDELKEFSEADLKFLPQFHEEWRYWGSCTNKANFEEAKYWAKKAYDQAGVKHPRYFAHVGSPVACARLVELLTRMEAPLTELQDNKKGKIGIYPEQMLGEMAIKMAEMITSDYSAYRNGQRFILNEPIPYKDGDEIEIWKQLAVMEAETVESMKGSDLRNRVGEQVYGYHEAGWLCFFDFADRVCNAPDERATPLVGLGRVAGWWAPYEHLCVIQDRASVMEMRGTELHCEDGPAVDYPDKQLTIWSLDNHTVDEQLVMHPETQTLQQIEEEQNADIRALRIARWGGRDTGGKFKSGWARYVREVEAECIDGPVDNEVEGTKEALFRTRQGDLCLVATCKTARIFGMRVPSRAQAQEVGGKPIEIDTCEKARKWLHGNRKLNVIGRT